MKRNRVDGQVSREEYDDERESPTQSPGNFSRATPNTLASRKFLSAQRGDKKIEFAKHIKALNSTFYAWFGQQVKTDASADLLNGVQDYIDYISQLEDRYLRSYGEVLTFGSGDCGYVSSSTIHALWTLAFTWIEIENPPRTSKLTLKFQTISSRNGGR